MGNCKVKLKRIYQEADINDGFRILVDRIWPRGLSKEKAKVDVWLKDIAPSHTLRKWFGHDPTKWKEFQKRYNDELDSTPELVNKLKHTISEFKMVTLLFSAADEDYNNAVVLLQFLNL